MSTSQHKNAQNVLAVQRKSVTRRLTVAFDAVEQRMTDAFLRTTRHLERLPAPRSVWTSRRRSSNRAACVGVDAVIACHRVLRAAIATGDAERIEGSALAVAAFGDEFVGACLAPYHAWANGETSLNDRGLAAHTAIGNAAHAIAQAIASQESADLARAVDESAEAKMMLQEYTEAARPRLSGVVRVVAMAVVMIAALVSSGCTYSTAPYEPVTCGAPDTLTVTRDSTVVFTPRYGCLKGHSK